MKRHPILYTCGLAFLMVCALSGDLVAQTDPPTVVPTGTESAPVNILDVTLPINTLETKDLVKRVGGKKISLTDLMSDLGIIVTLRGAVNDNNITYLEQNFQLKAKQVEGLPPNVRFFFFESSAAPDLVTSVINRIMSDAQADFVLSVSPLFLFDDGAAYAEDQLLIEWGSNTSKEDANSLVRNLELNVISFNETTHMMIAKTTTKSGWSVFRLASMIAPFAVSVEPLWVPLDPPVTITARIEPNNASGYAGDIVGSLFKFVLEVRSQKNATVNLNELKTTSTELQRWIPQHMNKKGKFEIASPQVFVLEDPEEMSSPVVTENGTTITTVTYRFRVLQAGVFRLKPPKVFYEYVNVQLKETVPKEYVGGTSVEFLVGSILPGEADMVNEVVLPEKPHVEIGWLLEKAKQAQNIAFMLLAAGGGLFLFDAGMAVVGYMQNRSRAGDVSALAPDKRWEHMKPTILQHLPDSPPVFWGAFEKALLAIFGLWVEKDECAFKSFPTSKMEKVCFEKLPKETHEKLGALFIVYKDAYDAVFNKENKHHKSFSQEDGKALVELVSDKLIRAQYDTKNRRR